MMTDRERQISVLCQREDTSPQPRTSMFYAAIMSQGSYFSVVVAHLGNIAGNGDIIAIKLIGITLIPWKAKTTKIFSKSGLCNKSVGLKSLQFMSAFIE